MKCRTPVVLLVGATLGFTVSNLVYGGPLGYGKSSKSGYEERAVPIPSSNRIGVQAAGGLGIKAEFLANAYTKYHPHVKTNELRDSDHEEFAPGVEVFYERVLSEHEEHLWGLRVGLGYMGVETEAHWSRSEGGRLESELDADILYATMGPFYEHRFTDRFYAQMSAGLAIAYVDARLKTEVAGLPFSASSTESDFLIGAYVSAAIGYDVAPNCSLLTGIRYQYLDRFDISNRMTSASLDSDGGYQVFVGLRWEF